MATKVIYFIISGKNERAEFRSDDAPEDVREIFRAAAEAGPHDILKLYNSKGNIVNISPRLPENGPDTQYTLHLVAAHCSDAPTDILGVDIHSIEQRIQNLEKLVRVDQGEMPPVVEEMKHKVDTFKEKLEGVEHLSWLGLRKEITSGTSLQLFWNKKHSIKRDPDVCTRVYKKFVKLIDIQVSDEVRQYLRKPTFDNWQWEEAEMLLLLRQMYIDLDLHTKFHIELSVLQQWLFEIFSHYNIVPFHNFKHCFMVSQMMYGLVWLVDLQSKLGDLEILVLLTSSICHDLDHPGYNNAYQINAKTELAMRYNDISPLENHHCAKAFEILEKPNCNIFRNVPKDTYKKIREGMIKCILATDMAKHSDILNNFKSVLPNFDFSNKDHKDVLLMILVKMADISNEVRPIDVAEPWLECLLEEFFNQSDTEKLEGLPVAPFMDREKVTKPSSQVGFIKFVLLPLFEALGDLFPAIQEDIILPVRHALDYYSKMQHALEDEKNRKNSTDRNDHVHKGEKNGLTKLKK